ncbi:cytochrome D1 domain-containing protein [Pantanalinema rosaneae CENA516]|uniref:cytochrome D1 domain-containing protein n=1 Tax=Pantanalinema rosaneae TaxID=1620701 RepID=UPI003D6DE0D4
MAQSSLLQLARAGNADAIAALMNASLQAIGVSARAVLRDGNLHILLESDRMLAQLPSIQFIQRGISRLGIGWVSSAIVYGRLVGQSSPIWVQRIDLRTTPLVNPFFLEPDVELEAATPPSIGRRLRQWHLPRLEQLSRPENVKLLHLFLLGVPLFVLFSTSYIWSRYVAGNGGLAPTSQTQSASQTKPGTRSQADGFNQAMQQATIAVNLGKTAATPAEWNAAIDQWQQAIKTLQAMPANHPRAAIVPQKVAEYRNYIAEIARNYLSTTGLTPVTTITGGLTPKSVVFSGKDLFFAQNMMYSHTINVYNRQFNLVKTISDRVTLADYGYPQFPGTQQGSPVEAAFSPDGSDAWVSNYQMYGATFSSNADDDCSPSGNHNPSFLYRIGTKNLNIDRVVQVGAVPKYVATTPNSRYVLASNWCSWDVSVVDPQQNKEIRRIQLGPYPRGIVVDAKSEKAYVAIMGSYDIAVIHLKDFTVDWLRGVGHSPRHLSLDPSGQYLYATLNGEGRVAKIDLHTGSVVNKIVTGNAPRSMVISDNGQFLYVVNYDSDTVSKVRTQDMQVVQTVNTNSAPIGITYDSKTHQVWVACYSGSIQVFQD